MKRGLNIVVLVILLVSPAFAQGSVENILLRLTEEWSKVPLKHDTAVLKRIWADDFVYVEPNGRVFNKEQGIAAEAKNPDAYTYAESSNVKIRVYGGITAVVIGDYREKGRDKDGKPFDRKSKYTNVWVLKSGTWQCVSGHSSDIP